LFFFPPSPYVGRLKIIWVYVFLGKMCGFLEGRNVCLLPHRPPMLLKEHIAAGLTLNSQDIYIFDRFKTIK